MTNKCSRLIAYRWFMTDAYQTCCFQLKIYPFLLVDTENCFSFKNECDFMLSYWSSLVLRVTKTFSVSSWKVHFPLWYCTLFGVSSKHLRAYLESLRQSSHIFGNFRKFSENVLERSSGLWDNFGKSLKFFRKSSKTPSAACLYNKKDITCQLEDMNFMFLWQEQYPTRLLRSLVRYCSCHLNIKFISSRHHVISSIK